MRTKKELYPAEREAITQKLIDILSLQSDNSFILYELDADIEKQAAICALKPEIARVFSASQKNAFKPNTTMKREYLCIARAILKEQGYTFVSSDYFYKLPSGDKKRTVKYFVVRASQPLNPTI